MDRTMPLQHIAVGVCPVSGGRTGLSLHPIDGFVGNRAVEQPEC